MENKELLRRYKLIQEIPYITAKCPRCGGDMYDGVIRNAISRHEDIYVCPRCGNEEAILDMAKKVKPLDEWYAVKLLKGNASYQAYTDKQDNVCYHLETTRRFCIRAKDIDDIMVGSLEGGVTKYWCNHVEVVGEYLGEFASDQISRGGKLIFQDNEDEKEYELTLEKFLKGLAKYISEGPDNILDDDGWVDPCNCDAIVADAIIQFALFDEIVFG